MELVKLDLIKKAIDEKKGEDIKIYDLTTSSPICSYMVVATMVDMVKLLLMQFKKSKKN